MKLECRYEVAEVIWSMRVLVSEGRNGSCSDCRRDCKSCSRKSRTMYTLFMKKDEKVNSSLRIYTFHGVGYS